MNIYCCGCKKEVPVRLTNGKEIYNSNPDLHQLPFWICDNCNNYVGCHHKTKDRTKPLGVIPTKEIRDLRKKIHNILDPLWRNGTYSRSEVYKKLEYILGYEIHIANIRSTEEAYRILGAINEV